MSEQRGLLSEGFGRVWRYQRVLWWMFVVNLVLALLGAWPGVTRMHEVADHSLRSQRLADTFDVGDFSALASNPEVRLFSGHGASLHFAIVFFVFALFLTGGILEAYRCRSQTDDPRILRSLRQLLLAVGAVVDPDGPWSSFLCWWPRSA